MIWYVEENKLKYPTVIPFHGILLSGMLRKNFKIEFGVLELWSLWSLWSLWRLCSENFKVLNAKKKLAWTDLDRVSFKKFFKESMLKSKNWRGLVYTKLKKASSAASVF